MVSVNRMGHKETFLIGVLLDWLLSGVIVGFKCNLEGGYEPPSDDSCIGPL